MLKNPFDRPAADPIAPDRLRGSALERARIVEHLAYLRRLEPLVQEFGSYATVLGGDAPCSAGGFELDTEFLFAQGFSKYPRRSLQLSNGSVAKTWDTGCDVNAIVQDPTREPFRYKFYLSLDLSTPDRLAGARRLVASVLTGARRERLSVQTKSEKHTYDSCNFYTWHPVELSRLLVEAASVASEDIWLPTEHFFQGKLSGIRPDRVGYVQEPLLNSPLRRRRTRNDDSHSDRMLKLGRHLDQGLAAGRALDEALFREATAAAWVRADRPWLLDM